MSEHDPSTNVSETEEDRMRLGALQTSEASRTVEAFYDPEERSIRREVPGHDRLASGREGVVRRLGEGESLGEAIEAVGDELGWESLSEFAREHLESEDEGVGESAEAEGEGER